MTCAGCLPLERWRTCSHRCPSWRPPGPRPRPVRRLRARSPWLWVAALAAAAVLCWLPFLGRTPSPDEGGLLTVAGQWAPGSSLYGDYWVDRPPLLIGLFALADGLGGALALRVMGLVAVALTVVLAGVVGRLAAGREVTTRAVVLPAGDRRAAAGDPALRQHRGQRGAAGPAVRAVRDRGGAALAEPDRTGLVDVVGDRRRGRRGRGVPGQAEHRGRRRVRRRDGRCSRAGGRRACGSWAARPSGRWRRPRWSSGWPRPGAPARPVSGTPSSSSAHRRPASSPSPTTPRPASGWPGCWSPCCSAGRPCSPERWPGRRPEGAGTAVRPVCGTPRGRCWPGRCSWCWSAAATGCTT